MDLETLKVLVEETIPFNKFLGMRVLHLERGHLRLAIPWRDELIGDPLRPAIHGGVISTLADVAAGMVLWSSLDNAAARLSTIDLRVDYLRPGRLEMLVAEAAIVRLGRTVGVADVRLFHESAEDETVATGKGVYAIKVPKHHGHAPPSSRVSPPSRRDPA